MKNNVILFFTMLENQALANDEISCYPFLSESTRQLIIPELVLSISTAIGKKIPEEDFIYFSTLQSALKYLDRHCQNELYLSA